MKVEFFHTDTQKSVMHTQIPIINVRTRQGSFLEKIEDDLTFLYFNFYFRFSKLQSYRKNGENLEKNTFHIP